MTVMRLFRSNGTQAVRLPKEVAFPSDVEVSVSVEGQARVVTPVQTTWNRYFASLDGLMDIFPDREQPEPQNRDSS